MCLDYCLLNHKQILAIRFHFKSIFSILFANALTNRAAIWVLSIMLLCVSENQIKIYFSILNLLRGKRESKETIVQQIGQKSTIWSRSCNIFYKSIPTNIALFGMSFTCDKYVILHFKLMGFYHSPFLLILDWIYMWDMV